MSPLLTGILVYSAVAGAIAGSAALWPDRATIFWRGVHDALSPGHFKRFLDPTHFGDGS